jgi:hypothetical protein
MGASGSQHSPGRPPPVRLCSQASPGWPFASRVLRPLKSHVNLFPSREAHHTHLRWSTNLHAMDVSRASAFSWVLSRFACSLHQTWPTLSMKCSARRRSPQFPGGNFFKTNKRRSIPGLRRQWLNTNRQLHLPFRALCRGRLGEGGSASGESSVFHARGFPAQAEIEGCASGEDSLVKASFASAMQPLAHDRRTLQPLVLKAGGTLECKPGSTTATVLSGGQCSNHWLDTDGTEGAQMDTRNHRTCHLMSPDGHEVQIYQRNGQFGFDAWPVDPTSDARHSAKHIWVAKDEIYRPPGECESCPPVVNCSHVHDAWLSTA